MKLSQHCLSAIPLAVAGYAAAGGSFAAAVAAGLSSVLMDLDHVGDYVLCNRGWGGIKHFFASCEEGRLEKLYLVLHSFEWVIFLWILIGTGIAAPWGVGLAVGMAGHLLLDWVGNRHLVQPSFYWLWFRAQNRFDGNVLYRVPPGTLAVERSK
uniref:Membrane-bound metal-dependent hydrolase (DUF457) n=1 Tax=Desulfovibrio sp. U5L TaxID=596152 RepID=I2Q1H6_9BACT